MRRSLCGIAALLAAAGPAQPARAWMHAGGWGGFGGHWGATGSFGHGWSASGTTAGGRSWNASGNAYGWHGTGSGGGQAGGNYHGWAAVGPNDHWATGSRYYGGGAWGAVHPPAVVNHYYGGSGCYNCGGWSGASVAAAGAAGLAVGAAAVARSYSVGTVYPVLPAGCAYAPYAGAVYYTCNGAWFVPAYGANGVYYQVVPAP